MNTPAWHRVIDDVARDMTAADPAADFRARVMARVSTTQPARLRPLRGLRRGAALAAAAAVAAIALGVTQPFRSTEPQESLARGSSGFAPVLAPADPATGVDVPATATAVRRSRAPQPSAALVEWRARNIPALADVAALEVEGIQPAGLSISQLSVTPLDIAPIAIPSIPQTDGGR